MANFLLIVAGGVGQRMGGIVPKQFMELDGKPVLMHTLEVFYKYDSDISCVLVLPENHIDSWNKLCVEHNFSLPHKVVAGGDTRFHSVLKGLYHIPEKGGLVAVHDGVRPFVSQDTLKRCFGLAAEKGNAIPVIPVIESIRKVTPLHSVAEDRSMYRIVQTPQVFDTELLHKAYRQPYNDSFTDDATVVESMGCDIYLTEGNVENIKITKPSDFITAMELLKGF